MKLSSEHKTIGDFLYENGVFVVFVVCLSLVSIFAHDGKDHMGCGVNINSTTQPSSERL